VVVAPLRLARGLQNKVLEAMAMARPVVAAQACVDALSARAGQDLMAAIHADDYVRQVDALLRDAPGATALALAGRQRVIDDYGWASQLAGLDKHLAQAFGLASAKETTSLSAQTA
jgi:glycosyltransferase involved in cell wall biosynthesis